MSDYMRNRKSLSSIADAYREMYATPNEEILNEELIDSIIEDVREEEIEDFAEYLDENKDLDEGALADKSKKSGISVGTLRKVYNRGMAAWKTGHRPGTTPQQWGMARVNAFISKKKSGKLNHDQDLAHIVHPDDNMLEELVNEIFGISQDPRYRAKVMKMLDDEGIKYKKDGRNALIILGVAPKDQKKLLNRIHKEFGMSSYSMIDEVQKVEVDSMKKVSKDMQKVLKAYQAIANKGDKELKNTKHNYDYEQVLKARDTILSMIGKLNTKMIIQQKMKKEDMMSEASAGAMIDKLFNLKGDKMAGYGVAKMLNMTGVKVVQQMQKQNPQGFLKTVQALGRDNKIKLSTNKALMKMFKDAGVKPLPEGLEEKVKDGKLDPLSKMGKSKLTGSEINQYYRDNPKQKAAARDKSVKKAIELALDLSGATNYAIKEIEKFKKGLSRHPAVKLALRHANESKEFTGHHVVIEALSPANVIKLKTFGKMMAKMTKLPFDENDPEKSIDKLMGQIWKQKHVPANWERLHKMVAMLRDIGVKMPSLKGKYMGLDPVTKKAIFYKEGTNEVVEWHQKIEEIKEGIEEIVEAQEMKDADVKKIAQMTDRNDHNGSLMHLAKLLGDRKSGEALKGIMQTHKALGHMPKGLIDTRMAIFDDLMKQSKKKYRNHADIYNAL